jgi:hypothetical protein
LPSDCQKMKKLFSIFLLVLIFNACSTDVDIIGPYQETTVVYGLLNPNDEVHYIKVNKTFLGTEDALIMAQNRDSSEYFSVKGRIEKWNGDNQDFSYNRTIRDTLVEDKEEGIFFSPKQTVYYFVDNNLSSDSEYRLVLDIENGKKEVTAQTPILSSSITPPLALLNGINSSTANGGVRFVNSYSVDGSAYSELNIEFNAIPNGKRYELGFVFRYDEVRTNGEVFSRSIPWNLGVSKSQGITGSEKITYALNGQSFFQHLETRIESNSSLVERRIFKGIDMVISVAGEELNTYMEVNEPTSGIVQERPDYTNINNGVGIFSSRVRSVFAGNELSLNLNTMRELTNGPFTQHLKFCSDKLEYQFENFYCP